MDKKDKKDIVDILNTSLTKHKKAIDEIVSKNAEHTGERLAKIETTLESVGKIVENQAQHCDKISNDLFKQTREQGERIRATEISVINAKEAAKSACDKHKALSARIWGILIGFVLVVVGVVTDIVLRFVKGSD